ncbi:metal ABC transporter substrate-binding protein [Bdellovibrionota bacterium FG-2]
MNQLLWVAVFVSSSILGIAQAHAKLSVLTSTTDLRALVAAVGGEKISVESIAKGTQDPHFIEAKPSFMLKANRADLLVSVGLDLEVGWLPSVIQGARNPNITQGQKGYLEVGPLVKPLELPIGAITRAEGDVHPLGNPHVTLDPIRDGEIAFAMAERLGALDPENAALYFSNAKAFQVRMVERTKAWQKRLEKVTIKKVITYHKTLTYFLDRFGIQNVAILEPKPGIPPTSGHVMEVIGEIKAKKVPLILVENYFDPTVTQKIKQEVPTVRTETVPVAVDGAPGMESLENVFENLIKMIEGK